MQEQQPDLEALYSRRRQLEEFLRHPVYVELVNSIEAIVRSKRNSVFGTRVGSLDVAFDLASQQAEIAGLQLAKVLVPMMLDDLNVDIAARLEVERETENGTDRHES